MEYGIWSMEKGGWRPYILKDIDRVGQDWEALVNA